MSMMLALRTPGSVSLSKKKPRELAYTATHDQAKPYGQIKKKKTLCARDWERMGSSQNKLTLRLCGRLCLRRCGLLLDDY